MSSKDHSNVAIFHSSWWHFIVTGYEYFVFNPLYDLSTEDHAHQFMKAILIICVPTQGNMYRNRIEQFTADLGLISLHIFRCVGIMEA